MLPLRKLQYHKVVSFANGYFTLSRLSISVKNASRSSAQYSVACFFTVSCTHHL